jgi:acyl-CoA thioesterase II
VASSRTLPYRARAIVGDILVAESAAPIRVDRPDAAPELWFPRDDVVDDALAAADGAWRAGDGPVAGHIAFDQEQVQLELIDAAAGDDPRDISAKRFPTWGDAADLIDIIDVRPIADGRFRSAVPCYDRRRPVVEGSQILGQSIVAASRHAP